MKYSWYIQEKQHTSYMHYEVYNKSGSVVQTFYLLEG